MSDIVVLEDRMAKFEKKMNAHRRALGRVERKVFNGFGIKIDAIHHFQPALQIKNFLKTSATPCQPATQSNTMIAAKFGAQFKSVRRPRNKATSWPS